MYLKKRKKSRRVFLKSRRDSRCSCSASRGKGRPQAARVAIDIYHRSSPAAWDDVDGLPRLDGLIEELNSRACRRPSGNGRKGRYTTQHTQVTQVSAVVSRRKISTRSSRPIPSPCTPPRTRAAAPLLAEAKCRRPPRPSCGARPDRWETAVPSGKGKQQRETRDSDGEGPRSDLPAPRKWRFIGMRSLGTSRPFWTTWTTVARWTC